MDIGYILEQKTVEKRCPQTFPSPGPLINERDDDNFPPLKNAHIKRI